MNIVKSLVLICTLFWLSGCEMIALRQKPMIAPKSVAKPPAVENTQSPSNENRHAPEPSVKEISPPMKKGGGYYLDDGPEDNPPIEINQIPNAVPTHSAYLPRSNRPYTALGQRFTPMTNYTPYKKEGIASWYGKRFHRKKTSSGEVYDMYAMTAAHPTLPIPSYVKVSNLHNDAFVIVRVNDRGPFKHDRLIDLSYAAAHKLGIVKNGSGKVSVELIDTRQMANAPMPITAFTNVPNNDRGLSPVLANALNPESAQQFFVQVGAFGQALNAEQVKQAITSQNNAAFGLGQNVSISSVYNNGLYKVRLGPYATEVVANLTASEIRKIHRLSAVVIKE
jgi:rare lipoprotein A